MKEGKEGSRELEAGFTLIELLVVVAIVGILAAIAIPQFNEYRQKSYAAAGITTIRNALVDIEVYFADGNTAGIRAQKGNTNGVVWVLEDANILIPNAGVGPETYLFAEVFPCTYPQNTSFYVYSAKIQAEVGEQYYQGCGTTGFFYKRPEKVVGQHW